MEKLVNINNIKAKTLKLNSRRTDSSEYTKFASLQSKSLRWEQLPTGSLKAIALQLDITPGDLANNTQKIIQHYEQNLDADLIVLNEMAISGYLPLDELFKPNYIKEVIAQINRLVNLTKNHKTAIILGDIFAETDSKTKQTILFDVAYFIENGEIKKIIKKQCLINYDVFKEARYFTKGTDVNNIIEYRNFKLLVLVCEDAWRPEITIEKYKNQRDIDFIVVINASPYEYTKLSKRHAVVKNLVLTFKAPAIYVHFVGGVDGIVFDGRSFLTNQDGIVTHQLKLVEEDVMAVNLTKISSVEEEKLIIYEVENQNHENINQNNIDDLDNIDFKLNNKNALEVYTIIQKSFADFVSKNNIQGVIIGLSGGIDSCLSAVIAVDTLGANNVLGVSIPSVYTSDLSKNIVNEFVDNLGIEFKKIALDDIFNTTTKALLDSKSKSDQAVLNIAITEENLQSRIRGLILMALSNDRKGYVVLCNGNKSELATGYFTLYGDSCGAFNLLKDLYKCDVYMLSNWRNHNLPLFNINNQSRLNIIPQAAIKRNPTAELKFNQKDEDSLLPYEILDKILLEIIENNLDYNLLVTKFNQKEVDFVLKLIKTSEFKRKQSVLGPKLSQRSLGQEWQYLITNKFKQ